MKHRAFQDKSAVAAQTRELEYDRMILSLRLHVLNDTMDLCKRRGESSGELKKEREILHREYHRLHRTMFGFIEEEEIIPGEDTEGECREDRVQAVGIDVVAKRLNRTIA